MFNPFLLAIPAIGIHVTNPGGEIAQAVGPDEDRNQSNYLGALRLALGLPLGRQSPSVCCADRVSQYSAQGLADALEPQALMEVCGIHPNFSINFLGASK